MPYLRARMNKILAKPIIIAVDGFASCGKSTLAKDLAKALNYIYVDTGAMYRSVTLYCMENKVDIADPKAIDAALQAINIRFERATEDASLRVLLNDRDVTFDIRTDAVNAKVSDVATIGAVREAMVKQQHTYGVDKGLTMDGRDIGTVVFPEAELKLFVTASTDVRTQRRYDEMIAKGMEADFELIKANLLERDRIDSGRAISPLRRAEDAVLIDNSDLSRQQQLEVALRLAELAAKGGSDLSE